MQSISDIETRMVLHDKTILNLFFRKLYQTAPAIPGIGIENIDIQARAGQYILVLKNIAKY